MTIFAQMCFSMIIIRFIEACIRFFAPYISRLTGKNKTEEVFAPDYKRLVATVTPEVYEVIKLHCTIKGITVTQYTLMAVMEKLKAEGVIE